MIDYTTPTQDDWFELDTMARTIWAETFGHACSAENLQFYLDQAYGPDGAMRRDLDDPAMRFRIARVNGVIAGYAKLVPLYLTDPAVPPDAAQLGQLYVASAWHGQGIAQGLIGWAIDTARADGAPALALTVWEENARAVAFYRRRGFEAVGEYAFKTGNQIDRDIVMRLWL